MMDIDMDMDMDSLSLQPSQQPEQSQTTTVIQVISEEECHRRQTYTKRPPIEYPIPEWVAPPTPEDKVLLQDEGAWIFNSWDEQTSSPETLNRFLARWPPSRTPDSYCSWIAVNRGSLSSPKQLDLPGLTTAFQQLVDNNNVTVESLDQISLQYGAVVGKWLVFIDPMKIDNMWGRIAGLLCLHLKNGQAKVAPRRGNDRHVICVYTNDYTNMEQVMALRNELKKAGIWWKIGFKPDAYTYLGIYAGNAWNIRPSRYYE
ncbi:translation initiation factor eIF 4e-like domain-containing protein [Cyathus striatus]|nr:translation initiation factor eIF 4e-like domain-containing protein [Cyathus striatus]